METKNKRRTADDGVGKPSSPSAMDPLATAIARYELDELAVKLRAVIKDFRSLHRDEPEGEAIDAVWNIVRLVSASALIEHLRLLGLDVAAYEKELRRGRSVVWRDLLHSGGDSETDDLDALNEPDAMHTEQLEPQSSETLSGTVEGSSS